MRGAKYGQHPVASVPRHLGERQNTVSGPGQTDKGAEVNLDALVHLHLN